MARRSTNTTFSADGTQLLGVGRGNCKYQIKATAWGSGTLTIKGSLDSGVQPATAFNDCTFTSASAEADLSGVLDWDGPIYGVLSGSSSPTLVVTLVTDVP